VLVFQQEQQTTGAVEAMLQTYQGYIENGRIITFGNPAIPDGSKVIITVLDEAISKATRIERKLQAIRELEEGLKDCEPLPPEFDEILSKRVNITRELDL
jgi:hypothetical protein